jgi:hypothetical protein
METQKNDCYQCKHRHQVPGSAHSMCKAFPDNVGMLVLNEIARGALPTVEINGAVKLTFNPVGIEGGWCYWPVNFDPCWITCQLSRDEVKALGHGKE